VVTALMPVLRRFFTSRKVTKSPGNLSLSSRRLSFSHRLKFCLHRVPVAYINRGNAYAKLGDDEQTLADFSQAIALDPTLVAIYYNRANLYIKQQACRQASDDMHQIQSLGGQLSQEFLAFFHQHCYDEAVKEEE
jgi:tetratricopeptide (TPR) repeat protein